jgi:hypothetical protein
MAGAQINIQRLGFGKGNPLPDPLPQGAFAFFRKSPLAREAQRRKNAQAS